MSAFATLLLHCAVAPATEIEVSVLTRDGTPVPGVVVSLESLTETPSTSASIGTMDQIDRQFVPHILVVQRGAEVAFPNSDSIKHHVFSFSEARTFEIRLFDDSKVETLIFDKPGPIELGCNVHDWMLGYIYVADTPYFGRTTKQGIASIEAPAAPYRVRIWHPRIVDEKAGLVTRLEAEAETLVFRLARPLLPPYEQESVSELQAYE